MGHFRTDEIGAGRQRLAEFDESWAKPDQRLGQRPAGIPARAPRAHQRIKTSTEPPHPCWKKRDFRDMA